MKEAPLGYNLIFTKRDNGKKILAKRVTDSLYKIFDPETGIFGDVTRFKLSKEYRSHKLNKKMRTKRAA